MSHSLIKLYNTMKSHFACKMPWLVIVSNKGRHIKLAGSLRLIGPWLMKVQRFLLPFVWTRALKTCSGHNIHIRVNPS